MNISFTGTQLGLTSFQAEKLQNLLKEYRSYGYEWFHHGDCIGADAQAAEIARILGYKLHKYPCNIASKQANTDADKINPIKPPLDRNRDIVNASNILIACPKEMHEIMRSGTWATIRYARKVKKLIHKIAPKKED